MQEINDDLKAAGATLVAITPQLPSYSKDMIEKHGIEFDMLSDPGNEYAAKLGLRFEVPEDVKAIYQGFKLPMVETNGDDSWTLPMPARIVVDSDGIVRATDIDPNYTSRPEPEKTLADVKALG
ncbi:MAG: redoxin domain-containing protein [Alphaproteobacteria bacterium]|nr:redoxin domain-containing protein [Alphaproteobacteria bacterium]